MSISKAVVTGGAGFIGSHIVDSLLDQGVETFVIDNLSTGSLDNLARHNNNKLLHVIIEDAQNIAELLSDVDGIDVMFHEAAIANVLRSVTEPMVVHDVNVNLSLKMMNFCVKKNIKRLVFASSAAVYGIIKDGPAKESNVCKPYSPYGATKLAVEDYLSAFYQTYGLETVALRYFNVYGARQKINDYSGVITIFTNQLLKGQCPTVFGDGMQTRDFISVKDIVQANMLAMKSKNAVGEVFNVASGTPINILKLLEILKSVTKTTHIQHKFAPLRPGDVKFGIASVDKIKSTLGFTPKTEISDGLADVTEFLKSMIKPNLIQT